MQHEKKWSNLNKSTKHKHGRNITLFSYYLLWFIFIILINLTMYRRSRRISNSNFQNE